MFFYTYILKSLKDGKKYTGFTKNLKLRFEQHNEGLSQSTKSRRPFKLIYYEACLNKEDAMKREKYFKTHFGKMFIKNRLKSYLTGGFTLIEILVALGLFMVVMTITLSAFLNIIDIQKKTEAFRKVNDNLNFAMEAMMREIREGKNYCPSGCTSGTFSFTNKDIIEVKYEVDKTGAEWYIKRKEGTNKPLRMTSDEIKITKLSFSVRGNVAVDKQQPLVTIAISGESGEKKFKSRLNLQATVSQRKLDPS